MLGAGVKVSESSGLVYNDRVQRDRDNSSPKIAKSRSDLNANGSLNPACEVNHTLRLRRTLEEGPEGL